ncbi:MAG: glycosyltransferase [Burkholderiales bacterium]|nr:glycosyltransferase [Burkholderiales bacterium]
MVLREMQRSAALLHPSRGEACSMAIAEAMSLGLPVIAGRRTDGVGWQLDQGRAGVLVDVNDARDIARGIEAATADFAIWLEMSAAARRRARELFSIDRVVDEYLSPLRGGAARGRGRRRRGAAGVTARVGGVQQMCFFRRGSCAHEEPNPRQRFRNPEAKRDYEDPSAPAGKRVTRVAAGAPGARRSASAVAPGAGPGAAAR